MMRLIRSSGGRKPACRVAARWMSPVLLLLQGAAWADDCRVSGMVAPERVEGRSGEIITLSDRSVWEVVESDYGFNSRARRDVIICPSSSEMGIGADVLRVRRLERTLSAESAGRSIIESTIKGRFSGWSGRTEFTLANGQVWRQVGSGSAVESRLDPKVRLTRKQGDEYEMQVDGVSRKLRVIRVR